MNELYRHFEQMMEDGVHKLVISKPASRDEKYQKIVVEKKQEYYQISCYTEEQVFHKNVKPEELCRRCAEMTDGSYRQVNGWSQSAEHMLMISAKGNCTYKKRKTSGKEPVNLTHNRSKRYLISEGQQVPPLVDMGVFTKEGKVVNDMYDKYKQINRFLEILDDEISNRNCKELNVIDFGCGKSYLTFVVYYYLTEIRGIKANMIGLDLKADVIEKCNAAAEKYGYQRLRFALGDINGFTAPFRVDAVITLHACDTATDYALYNAVSWNAEMIFSVPCCQHELNDQIQPENLSILTHYGIIKERFSALATDAVRGNLLEYCGYKTQLLEFVDFAHTPKNILIRAVKRPVMPRGIREKVLKEVHDLMDEFHFSPTLYRLLDIPTRTPEI